MSSNVIKLVVKYNDNVYKASVCENTLKKNENGQFILPPDTISAGFANRVWDIEWDKLPLIESNKFSQILQKY